MAKASVLIERFYDGEPLLGFASGGNDRGRVSERSGE
jgi:hypothetical protein